ncbi:hypothetical protein O6P43_020010 [Quillaja saponaria]|uniref:Uncharacterized protein n=1 Tax=Quillaja saponaria TaxID=32244 RepID=A0AAD7LKA6_QUISA|nr:hypothetical protein O6P43_020010 [Quillaja saponaria]
MGCHTQLEVPKIACSNQFSITALCRIEDSNSGHPPPIGPRSSLVKDSNCGHIHVHMLFAFKMVIKWSRRLCIQLKVILASGCASYPGDWVLLEQPQSSRMATDKYLQAFELLLAWLQNQRSLVCSYI